MSGFRGNDMARCQAALLLIGLRGLDFSGADLPGWCTSGSAKMKNWRLAVQKWKREGWKTKHTPHVPSETMANEPAGWLAYMREHYSGWKHFDGGATPTWQGLPEGDRKMVFKLMDPRK